MFTALQASHATTSKPVSLRFALLFTFGQAAEAKKAEGNTAFGVKDYETAIVRYSEVR